MAATDPWEGADDRVNIDYLILADWAEVINGKIYVQGGGWTTINAYEPLPVTRSIAIAVSPRVEWSETNTPHTLEIRILREEGQAELAKIDARFEVGRRAGLPMGSSQPHPLAVNLPLKFEHAGEYEVRASIDGEEVTTLSFRIDQQVS
jgi:hypothetical protein